MNPHRRKSDDAMLNLVVYLRVVNCIMAALILAELAFGHAAGMF
jgi:hypothetical protein